MVLQGQDAWRKHPLLSGLWKKPFPHLGLAVGLFAVYCTAEAVFDRALAPAPAAYKQKYTFKANSEFGDEQPEAKKIGGGGHH